MARAAGRPEAASAPALRAITDAIVAQTSLGVWGLDADDHTNFVNARMADLVGSTPEEMLGAPIYDFLDAGAGEATRVALRRRRIGVSELRELDLVRRDGSRRSALVESMPLKSPDGGYAGAVAIVADITARKLIEREVGLLAALVRASSDAIVACSLDGSVRSWNPAAEALFGWTAAEMTGRSLGVILAAGPEGVVRLVEATTNGTLVGPWSTTRWATLSPTSC
jgi:PAS domain S-box-containing protein